MTENILTLIHFDVWFALKKLTEQVTEKKLKMLLIKSNRKLFDVGSFQEYLSKVKIKNTFILEDIISKSNRIIKLNDIDFLELEKLRSENSENSEMPREYITIEHEKIFSLTNGVGVKEFLKEGGFEMFLSQHFAKKCASLINMLTAAYPNLKTEVPKQSDKDSEDQNKTNNFSHKQIAIAYFFLEIQITEKNSNSILKKWSGLTSVASLCQNRVSSAHDLIKLSGNPTSDTKHLKNLKEAKRLIFLLKNKKALTSINRVLTSFQNNYENR